METTVHMIHNVASSVQRAQNIQAYILFIFFFYKKPSKTQHSKNLSSTYFIPPVT